MTTFTKATVLTAALLTSLIGATAAFAGEATEQVAFKYSKSAPLEQTYATLKEQAKRQCSNELGAFKQYAGRKCMTEYMDQIVEKIGAPMLSAYHNKWQSKTDSVQQFADASATASIGK